MQNDDEVFNTDNANQQALNDAQEDLTQEELEETLYKTLTSNNPQAPHNLTKFSHKDRCFKVEEIVDQITFHYSSDGNILLKDSDEARDQEEFWENKEQAEKKMAALINAAIIEERGEDPCK